MLRPVQQLQQLMGGYEQPTNQEGSAIQNRANQPAKRHTSAGKEARFSDTVSASL